MEIECIFKDVRDCPNPIAILKPITEKRRQSVIRASERREDNLKTYIEDIEKLYSHESCLKSYTSASHMKDKLKRRGKHDESTSSEKKKTRRSHATFDFKEHCLFCGMPCRMQPDKKNPSRWRVSCYVRTVDRGAQLPFKTVILNKCNERDDIQAEEVAIRVNGAITDLHSAEARYHDDCRKKFMATRNIQSAANKCQSDDRSDVPFETVCRLISDSPERIWSSIELHTTYKEEGGICLSRRQLMAEIRQYFGENILLLSSPGIASILLFRSHASSLLNVVKDDDNDIDFEVLSKTVRREISTIPKQKEVYNTRIDFHLANNDVSPTVNELLKSISPKFENSLSGLLIGNIITSVVSNRTTPLQVALGLLANKKTLVQHLFNYRVTCSPDEMRRFRLSAATECAEKDVLNDISAKNGGLIQVVIDNFDTSISSQNGLKQTHSLATIITQPILNNNVGENDEVETFPRLKKADLKEVELPNIPMCYYEGPKKPTMPGDTSTYNVYPLRFLAHQAVALKCGKKKDFDFFRNICCVNEAEFSGFNTKLLRESGVNPKPKNRIVYRPLIDKNPADPSTVLTAMLDAKRLVNDAGQKTVVMTADQQIYRIMVDISWTYDKEMMEDFVLRLGGMHLLMSFVGCVGNLMANSGLEELMKSAFAGVAKMLSGKNFPMNVRALRMVAEELLRKHIYTFSSYDEMIEELDKKSKASRTAKHWVDNLIKPVLIMMIYVRAEREGEFPLHLYAVELMLPYFFASGHINYARYASYYLRSMQSLPNDILSKFMAGEHVMRHQRGLFNGIWSDMYIETTFMRHGKGPRGLVGITLKPKTVKQWSLSLHACAQVIQDLEEMIDGNCNKDQFKHKEELPGRILSDTLDRIKIREKLESIIHPLEVNESPDHIINIFSGSLSPESVDVDDAVEIGTKKREQFDLILPGGFYDSIKKEVTTMSVIRKSIKVGDVDVYDTEVIFARVMCLLNTGQVKLEDVFSYELSPVPVSLFKEDGEMRISKNKSDLKNALKVDVSARIQDTSDAIIIDGCAMLYAVYWPTDGTVNDLVQSVKAYLRRYDEASTIYLVFDRYFDFSPKGGTRQSRAGRIRISHELFLETPLPAQKTVLGSYGTKERLIALIVHELKNHYREQNNMKMIITGKDSTTQSKMGVSILRDDLKTTQEEADVIMIKQLITAYNEGARCVKVICDDTDVFLLLMYFYYKYKMNCNLLMEGTSGDRTVISIPESVAKLENNVVDSLLAMHALSGCDTVPQLSGIGKKKALNALKKGKLLSLLGDISVTFDAIVEECCIFIGTCYGVEKYSTMTMARYMLWNKKIANKSAPQLKSLPPTIDVLKENIKRAHYQTAIWKHSDKLDPPPLDPSNFGWYKDEDTRCLLPVMLPPGFKVAPQEVLKLIRCGCSSHSPCSPSSRCSCSKAQMSCSEFCACFSNEASKCCNKWTAVVNDNIADER